MSEAVVVDTNILIRAFLSGKMDEDAILRKANFGNKKLVYGKEQLAEFTKVLGYERIRKKYAMGKDKLIKIGRWLMSKKLTESEEISVCRDPNDNYVIGLALKAARRRKTYLVTGDKDILVLEGKFKNLKILTAGEFLKI